MFKSDLSGDSSKLQHSKEKHFLLRLVFNRLHNQPHIVRQASVYPATDEQQRLNTHLSLDMANYTSIHSGPDGRCSLHSSLHVEAEERGGPIPRTISVCS